MNILTKARQILFNPNYPNQAPLEKTLSEPQEESTPKFKTFPFFSEVSIFDKMIYSVLFSFVFGFSYLFSITADPVFHFSHFDFRWDFFPVGMIAATALGFTVPIRARIVKLEDTIWQVPD